MTHRVSSPGLEDEVAGNPSGRTWGRARIDRRWGVEMEVRGGVPTRVKLDVGDQTTFALPNHAAGGYRWAADVSGDAAMASIAYAETGPTAGLDDRLGQVLHLTGVRAGEAVLVLEERRSWEQGTPADRVVVRVVVRARDSDQRES